MGEGPTDFLAILLPELIGGLPAIGPFRSRLEDSNATEPAKFGGCKESRMQNQSKPVVINTRQVTLELAALALRAFAAGLAVSLAASLLIVSFVTIAS